MTTIQITRTTTSDDYRIEVVQNVTLNGAKKIIFKAFKKCEDAFVFYGNFSAPARTTKKNLWKIADNATGWVE